MKKKLLMFCYIINMLMIGLMVAVIIGALLKMSNFVDYVFFNEFFLNIRMLATIPIIALWINNLIVWSKKDKDVVRFLLLFFFNGLYSPFYYRRVLKNKWQ